MFTKFDVKVGDEVLVRLPHRESYFDLTVLPVSYKHATNRWLTVQHPAGYRQGYSLYSSDYIGVMKDGKVYTNSGVGYTVEEYIKHLHYLSRTNRRTYA